MLWLFFIIIKTCKVFVFLGGENKLVSYTVNTNRSLFLLVVLFVLVVYYSVGGYGFPDYSNYVTLVRNGGFLRSPDEYAAEWLSRLILRNPFGLFDSAESVVDCLALIVQFFYIAFIYALMQDQDEQYQRGWLFFTLALSPLLLTTALRAAPAYIVIAYLASYGKVLSPKFLILSLLAIAFHDSAIVMILLYVTTVVFCDFFPKVQVNLLRWVMIGALLLILLSQQISFLLVSLMSHFEFGIRSVYFQGGVNASILKKIFMVFVWFVSWTALFNERSAIKTKVFLATAAFLMACAFAISEVAGIRFSAYVLGVAVVSKGAFLLSGNSEDKYSRADMLIGFAFFGFMFFDIFRNVKS